jgi:hypothetical protein
MERQESDDADEFLLMGTYSIVDAEKLLHALESHGVEHSVEFRDGAADISPALSYFGGAFGQAAQATIRVAPANKDQADKLHAELFGDCLPNYDASFFKDSNDASDGDVQA